MRGSHEKTAPPELSDWLALESPDWKPCYPFPGDIRQPVVDALQEAQRGLCVYCGRKLDHDPNPRRRQVHIEHFRPQARYPVLATSFPNLFLSCGPDDEPGQPSEICGNAKDNGLDESSCIEPDYPECTRRFRFLLSGEVTPRQDEDSAARMMLKLLNLNHRELRKEREDILNSIDLEGLDVSDFLDPDSGLAESYAHVACEHLGTVIP